MNIHISEKTTIRALLDTWGDDAIAKVDTMDIRNLGDYTTVNLSDLNNMDLGRITQINGHKVTRNCYWGNYDVHE